MIVKKFESRFGGFPETPVEVVSSKQLDAIASNVEIIVTEPGRLWVNVNGVCALRVTGIKLLTVDLDFNL